MIPEQDAHARPARLHYHRNARGDYDLVAPDRTTLFNLWRSPAFPTRWLVSVGHAPFPNATRHEAATLGLKIIGRRELLPDLESIKRQRTHR